MASICRVRGKWRALIRLSGLPAVSKSFDAKEDAERWAARSEKSMLQAKRLKDAATPGQRANSMPDLVLLQNVMAVARGVGERAQELPPEIAHLPILSVDDGCGVYFLMRAGRVVYIGQSVNVLMRVRQHIGKIAFDFYKWLPVERGLLDQTERRFIRLLDPPANRVMYGLDLPDPGKVASAGQAQGSPGSIQDVRLQGGSGEVGATCRV